jgi:hypothetical protein
MGVIDPAPDLADALPDGVHRTEQQGRFAATAAITAETAEALGTVTR